MHTSGYVMQDLPNPDGHIFIPISPANGTANGGTRTRLGSGLVATVVPTTVSAIFEIPISEQLLRYGMQDDSQMQFGQLNGTSGANALPLLPGTVFNSPYSTQARPPIASANYFGSNTGSAKVIPKGIAIRQISVVYQPLTAALTSMTLGITKTQFASGVAPVVTTLLANANNGLLLPVAAQPIVVTIPLLAANQIMLTSRFAEYLIELDVTVAGGTLNLFGLFLDVNFNLN